MSSLAGRLAWNPIVSLEVRARMRTWRAEALLVAFLGVLGVVGYAVYRGESVTASNATSLAQVGLYVFGALAATVLALVTLLVPALVGGSVASERERQTLDLLLCTPVGPARIVVGKLLAALAFVGLLLAAAAPVFGVVFLLGGVTLGQVLVVLLVEAVSILALGGLAMLASVMLRRSATAIVTAYLGAFLLFLGPLLAGAIWSSVTSPNGAVSVGSVGVPATSPPALVPPISAFPGPIGPPAVPLRPGAVSTPAGVDAGPSTVMLLSPGLAMAETLSALDAGSSGSCGMSQVLPMRISYSSPCATSICAPAGKTVLPNGRVFVNQSCSSSGASCSPSCVGGDVLAAGPFGGWPTWQVFALLDAAIGLASLAGAVAVLRGRRRRRAQPGRTGLDWKSPLDGPAGAGQLAGSEPAGPAGAGGRAGPEPAPR